MVDIVVLCGGLGTRIASVSRSIPKCLLPVGNVPVLERLLDHWIGNVDISRIVLCVSHLGHLVEQYFGDSYRGISVSYSRDQLQGSGGALQHAANTLGLRKFCVLNGDTYFSYAASKFIDQAHRILECSEAGDCKVVTCSRSLAWDNGSRFDSIIIDPLTSFVFEGFGSPASNVYRSSARLKCMHVGWVYFEDFSASLKQIDIRNASTDIHEWSLERRLLRSLVESGNLKTVVGDGVFFDIGVPDDYHLADKLFRSFT